jgi:hypothetical protein
MIQAILLIVLVVLIAIAAVLIYIRYTNVINIGPLTAPLHFDGTGCVSMDVIDRMNLFQLDMRMNTNVTQSSVLCAIGNPGPAHENTCEGSLTFPCNSYMLIYMTPAYVQFLYDSQHSQASSIIYISLANNASHDISIARVLDDTFVFRVDAIEKQVILTNPPDPMPPSKITLGCSKFNLPDSGIGKFKGCIQWITLSGARLANLTIDGVVTQDC